MHKCGRYTRFSIWKSVELWQFSSFYSVAQIRKSLRENNQCVKIENGGLINHFFSENDSTVNLKHLLKWRIKPLFYSSFSRIIYLNSNPYFYHTLIFTRTFLYSSHLYPFMLPLSLIILISWNICYTHLYVDSISA